MLTINHKKFKDCIVAAINSSEDYTFSLNHWVRQFILFFGNDDISLNRENLLKLNSIYPVSEYFVYLLDDELFKRMRHVMDDIEKTYQNNIEVYENQHDEQILDTMVYFSDLVKQEFKND